MSDLVSFEVADVEGGIQYAVQESPCSAHCRLRGLHKMTRQWPSSSRWKSKQPPANHSSKIGSTSRIDMWGWRAAKAVRASMRLISLITLAPLHERACGPAVLRAEGGWCRLA